MSSIINWSKIPVAQMDCVIAFCGPIMQVPSYWENVDYIELAVSPRQDPTPGRTLVRFDNITSSTQGTTIYLHVGDLAATSEHVVTADGQCVSGPLELGQDIGVIALSTDNKGNCVGLHQPVQYFQR